LEGQNCLTHGYPNQHLVIVPRDELIMLPTQFNLMTFNSPRLKHQDFKLMFLTNFLKFRSR
jgi:hypothetical protein